MIFEIFTAGKWLMDRPKFDFWIHVEATAAMVDNATSSARNEEIFCTASQSTHDVKKCRLHTRYEYATTHLTPSRTMVACAHPEEYKKIG